MPRKIFITIIRFPYHTKQKLSPHCKDSEFWYCFTSSVDVWSWAQTHHDSNNLNHKTAHHIPSIYVTPCVKGHFSRKHRVSPSVLAGEWVVINSYNWFSIFSRGCLRHSLLLFILRQQRPLWQSSLMRVELIRSVQAASPMDSSSLTPTNPRADAKHGWHRETHSPLVDTH